MSDWDGTRLAEDVQRLADRALPREQLHRELAARLRRVLSLDAACWHGLDPDTRLLTTANPEELLAHGYLTLESEPRAAQSVLASEYSRADVNSFASLARRRSPVGLLSQATRGRPERSARFREFLSACGTPYELRTVFVARHRAWGCVVMHRRERSGDFTQAETQLMAQLSRPIAEAIKQSVRLDAARRADAASAPGLVLLGPRNEPEVITEPAVPLLESLRDVASAARHRVPTAVRAIADAARAERRGQTLHVAGCDGWVTLHASLPEGGHSTRVAVVMERSASERSAALRLEAFGLTVREREVAGLVARGLSTTQISEQLFLSPWTVQDHLKAIFDKTGARNRRELRAVIFFQEQLPMLLERSPLDADGHLARTRVPDRLPLNDAPVSPLGGGRVRAGRRDRRS